jgi:hypothetical protein
MDKEEHLPPIVVTQESGKIRIRCEQTDVGFSPGGPEPAGASAMACRVFHALMHDLPPGWRAE